MPLHTSWTVFAAELGGREAGCSKWRFGADFDQEVQPFEGNQSATCGYANGMMEKKYI